MHASREEDAAYGSVRDFGVEDIFSYFAELAVDVELRAELSGVGEREGGGRTTKYETLMRCSGVRT